MLYEGEGENKKQSEDDEPMPISSGRTKEKHRSRFERKEEGCCVEEVARRERGSKNRIGKHALT